jgi:hypothetical protein
MKKKDAKAEKQRYLQLSELGTKFNLSFSSHIVVGDKIVGLDGIKKQLLVANLNDKLGGPYIIDLAEVSSISLKKSYSNIMPGELKKRGFEEFLNYIHLQFEYKDDEKIIVLPFYEREKDGISNRSKMETYSNNWQSILSKIIGSEKKEIPIDGELLTEGASFNTAALTGESKPSYFEF